ncbi:DegT/DnrJ/EryC1/StrS family aminotransferase [Pseudoalteromonas denitrificans]|uniref:dTDP-4-amino-4,6-dideoxygalactose transaminase n=1 Tax=Pseudoalteromonas denitrificans DSM 6059 TaxID=1123010 RepID=A0A1I1K0G9_9GAMM|nr:DegT/DnrJ/EryC1/StrS family aminotransferase [Pseudoalteromonas denitrificans]SFC52238.1 dTDP-4-amino-4,6-dideoxygalactose transaminase [Pseudoalteromonas denitrificans DSM 6059]
MKYPIVKPYLPCLEKYQNYISDVFERNWLTNNGPLVQKLEKRLAEYLGVEHLLLVANGTLALQVAYAALGIKGKVLTTPFSFAATASSLVWHGLQAEFIDVDAGSFNLNADNISTEQIDTASAILAVHVFGNPCEVEKLAALGAEHDMKIIYDAAHAFGSNFNDQSVLNYGDAATLSFHATKLFHSTEGGAIIFKNKADYDNARQLINFGFDKNNHPELVGINAKMSEMHAAMGLTVLENIDHITAQRSELVNRYHQNLETITCELLQLQHWHVAGVRNGAYMPVLFKDESSVLLIADQLANEDIGTRRYFHPSLSQVEAYGMKGDTPIANDIASRILCLPLYTDLTLVDVDYICDKIKFFLDVRS